MAPLTLEQVLARSMRLPRQRIKANFFGRPDAPRPAGGGHVSSGLGDVSPVPSSSGGGSCADRLTNYNAGGMGTPSMEFLLQLEKEDTALLAKRISIQSKSGSRHFIRNSQDLLTYLNTAKRVGAWEDAVTAFYSSTNTGDVAERGEAGCRISPNNAHLHVLIDACASSDRLEFIERFALEYGPSSQAVLVHAVQRAAEVARRMHKTGPSVPETTSRSGWKVALEILEKLPPSMRPIAAYNACLTECERTSAWEAALTIIQSLSVHRATPVLRSAQPITPTAELHSGESSLSPESSPAELSSASTGSETAGDGAESGTCPTPELPIPDAVSYAVTMATLEQAGQHHLSKALLESMPAVEREAITASYAALIHVWADQVFHQKRRRR